MNNETKHTPGPWYRNIKPASKYPIIFAGDNLHVAQVISRGVSEAQCEANCDLIAAAPETAAERDRLREALKDALAWIENLDSLDANLDLAEDGDREPFIEAMRTALEGSKDPSPSQRVRDAAPELLEACRQALSMYEVQLQLDASYDPTCQQLRAAIAKAEAAL